MTCSWFTHFCGQSPIRLGWKVDPSTLFAFGIYGVCTAHAIIACLHGAVVCLLSWYCKFVIVLTLFVCCGVVFVGREPLPPTCPDSRAAARLLLLPLLLLLLLCCCCCPPVSLKRISYFPKQDFSATFSCISRLIRYLGQFVLSLGETQQENLLRGGFLLGVRWSCAFAEMISHPLSVYFSSRFWYICSRNETLDEPMF